MGRAAPARASAPCALALLAVLVPWTVAGAHDEGPATPGKGFTVGAPPPPTAGDGRRLAARQPRVCHPLAAVTLPCVQALTSSSSPQVRPSAPCWRARSTGLRACGAWRAPWRASWRRPRTRRSTQLAGSSTLATTTTTDRCSAYTPLLPTPAPLCAPGAAPAAATGSPPRWRSTRPRARCSWRTGQPSRLTPPRCCASMPMASCWAASAPKGRCRGRRVGVGLGKGGRGAVGQAQPWDACLCMGGQPLQALPALHATAAPRLHLQLIAPTGIAVGHGGSCGLDCKWR